MLQRAIDAAIVALLLEKPRLSRRKPLIEGAVSSFSFIARLRSHLSEACLRATEQPAPRHAARYHAAP